MASSPHTQEPSKLNHTKDDSITQNRQPKKFYLQEKGLFCVPTKFEP